MAGEVRDDVAVVDGGRLEGLANFLALFGGGPRQALVGGVGSLAGAVLALTVLHDTRAAALFVALATWCFVAGWFVHRFSPSCPRPTRRRRQ